MNIAPLILAARSLSRMPSAAPISQCGTRWCSAYVVGQVDRALDDRVVGVAGAVGRVGVRQVGDAQQQVAQLVCDDVELVGQHPLVLAERAAARLQLLGAGDVAVAAQLRRPAFDSSLTSARMASRLATMSRDSASKAIARSSWSSTSG